MAIRFTVLGALISGTMLFYFGAFVTLMLKLRRLGNRLYGFGFAIAVLAFLYRWQQVGHVPLQSLFEVFLCLGMLLYPLSVFCRRFLRVGGEGFDALIGFAVLFPAGFVFKAQPQRLPPALQSWLFVPHVAAYMLAYVVLMKASVQALAQLLGNDKPDDSPEVPYETATYRLVNLGFPLLTLGLLLGSVWGKMAWGNYWHWDPKELWSLAMWLAYLAYFRFRCMSGARYHRINSTLVVCGSVIIVITLLWVNLASRLFPGLHSYAA